MSETYTSQIMNIPCNLPKASSAERAAYSMGHRDARHEAAAIATEADTRIEKMYRLLKAVTLAAETGKGDFHERPEDWLADVIAVVKAVEKSQEVI